MRNGRKIDVMHEIHEGVRLHIMFLHEAGQRGAMLVVQVLLHFPRRDRIEPKQILDERRHPLVDLGKQIAFGGVERVVEVEDPEPCSGEGFRDAGPAARAANHRHCARSACRRRVR